MEGLNKLFGPFCSTPDMNDNNDSSESVTNFNKSAAWINMKDSHIIQILSYVNYSDLLQCRLVSKQFRHVISKSRLFIDSTIFVSSSKSPLLPTSLLYETCRFEHIDHDVFTGAKTEHASHENASFSTPPQFLANLKTLHFSNSYITWDTIKRTVVATPALERFVLTACKFVDQKNAPGLTEFEEFRVGRTFSHLKSVKIKENHDLRAVNTFLEKLVGYCSKGLEEIWITFDPSTSTVIKPSSIHDAAEIEDIQQQRPDMDTFCTLVRTIIESNTFHLRSLVMDLKYQPLLDIFLPSVFGKMNSLWAELNLEEFVLSPPSSSGNSVEISLNCTSSAQILIGLLESQVNLRSASLPHFRNMGEAHYRVKIGQSLSPQIKYLSLPNQDYLPKEFLSKFTSLKKLYLGGSTGDNGLPVALHSQIFEQVKTPVSFQQLGLPAHLDLNLALSGSAYNFVGASINTSTEVWDKFTELGLGSTIINGIELLKIIKKFHFLTKLEILSELPVIQDEDMQILVEGIPLLRHLNVAACDFLTDYGVTGILRNSCEMMVRLRNYHGMEEASVMADSRANNGRSMAQLKGLRSLILMGKSHITDVGIHFGLRFPELETAFLPYNQNITEWGIQKFGEHNPSLQVFVMCAINQKSREGFFHLRDNHPRVRKNKCEYLKYIEERNLSVENAPSSSSMEGLCSAFHFGWNFFSRKTQDEEQQAQRNDEVDRDDKKTEEQVDLENAGVEVDDMIPIPTLSLIIPSQKVDVIAKNEANEVKVDDSPVVPQIASASVKKIKVPKLNQSGKKSVVWTLESDDEDVQDNNAV